MSHIIKYIFPILLLFCACLICSIKLQALDNWLFSSDLFSYDTMLQETLKGNFAVEYTYANFFGDHAYISFLLMLPLKILLGRHMVHLLVLLSPLFYLACGIGLFCYLYKRNIPLILFFVLSIGFLLHFEVFAGNYEGIYGFHFDNASGYVLFLIALLSVPYQGIFKPNPLWMIITLLFLLMKEEMALLGVIYFGVCWLLDRRKQWIQWTVTATLIFLIELLIIHHCKTPFNRGNILIIQQFFESLHTKGPCFWFTAAPMNAFWNYLILVSVTFVFLCISNRRSPIAIALFVTGLAKTLFAISISDYAFDTWHGFPALVMFTGAIIIQAAQPQPRLQRKIQTQFIVIVLYVGITLSSFYHQYDQWKSTGGCINYNHHYRIAVEKEVSDARQVIDKNKVVAMNTFLSKAFTDGYRYSFFPRGVEMSPFGIAEYVLIDKEYKDIHPLSKSPISVPTQTVLNEFSEIYENQSFAVYKRIKPSARHDCNLFRICCGQQSF